MLEKFDRARLRLALDRARQRLSQEPPGKARFRTFVRVCADRFVMNSRQSATRQKRGGGHHLGRRENQKDFRVRMRQFFDRSLKGAPAPQWMTEGVPQVRKGLDPLVVAPMTCSCD